MSCCGPGEAVTLSRTEGYWVGRFAAFGSRCEVMVDCDEVDEARALCALAAGEALRIERKFSRYRNDNLVHAINHSAGRRLAVDSETADLLDYAGLCHRLSDGLFDVTSGVLRRAWRFDGTDRVPGPAEVQALLSLVGWDRLRWERPHLTLPPGMEIDLGGIGKEYAVDRSLARLTAATGSAVLVNYGGDLRSSGARRDGRGWQVGIEPPAPPRPGAGPSPILVGLTRGALATSGDARRYLLRDGVRYGHVLDPRSGWPVAGAPRSVTVAADLCVEAGMLATLALLRGPEAEAFLRAEAARYWCQW